MPKYEVTVESTIITDHIVDVDDSVVEQFDAAADKGIKLAMKEVPAADDYQVAEITKVN